MEKNKLFIIFGAIFSLAGIIFLLVAMFGENQNNWMLASALVCICISNILNIVRGKRNE